MSERKREKFRRKTDLEEEGKGEGGGKGIEFLDILFQEWGIELLGKEQRERRASEAKDMDWTQIDLSSLQNKTRDTEKIPEKKFNKKKLENERFETMSCPAVVWKEVGEGQT